VQIVYKFNAVISFLVGEEFTEHSTMDVSM
jgi:hypothetical protein